MVTIRGSVGRGGMNQRADVQTVQAQINKAISKLKPMAPLVVDGRNGPKTIAGIVEYQKKVVGLASPDGRVDPGGKTMTAFNASGGAGIGGSRPPGFAPGFAPGIAGAPRGPGFVPEPQPVAAPAPRDPQPGNGAGTGTVVYASDMAVHRRIVHNYSFQVIAMVMENAGCSKAVITSTIRSVKDQVDTMYKHAGMNLAGQYRLYGSVGDKVLKVYEANKDKPEADVKALMIAKCEELAKLGQRVSLHVTTPAAYANLNIIDIGLNSTRYVAGDTFNADKITAAFRKAETDGYIHNFIDETKKVNTCWHVEIKPNAKPVPASCGWKVEEGCG